MSLSLVYAVRGFIAFIAFIEFVNALRSFTSGWFVEPEDVLKISFVQTKIFTQTELSKGSEVIISQLFGLYSFLNSSILIATAIFVHYRALVGLSVLVLLLKLFFYVSQGFIYKTISLASSFQVPVLFTLCGLSGLICILCLLESDFTRYSSSSSENDDLLKQMKFPKSRRAKNL